MIEEVIEVEKEEVIEEVIEVEIEEEREEVIEEEREEVIEVLFGKGPLHLYEEGKAFDFPFVVIA
jgi:hypothetical protein